VGTSVTITGTGFTGATDVDFNGTNQPTVSGVTATQVTADVPTGATTGKITVLTPNPDTASASVFVVGTAAAPTIGSFTPAAGPVGASVTITGTNFGCTTSVKFNNVAATSFVLNSATSITATVPAGATSGKISVTNTIGTATSATDFGVAGVPTITSFTPAFGPVGKSITITGTNFKGTGFTTTSVKFNGVTATFVVNSATSITATVPTGATTGKITVTTPGGTATSAADFTVSTTHRRSVSLSLRKHLVARGKVSVSDAFTACFSTVPVTIQHRSGGSWKNVKRTTTSTSGAYKVRLKDVAGKYRALLKKVVLSAGTDICLKAKSPTRTN
jgi:large repetitive protein